jgi:hypothetical protein
MHSQLANKQASKVGGRRGRDISGLPQAKQEKIEKRRERNRLAAAKCRQKKLNRIEDLTGKVEQLQQENAEKQEEMRQVLTEVERLKSVWQQHRQSGCTQFFPFELDAQVHSLEAPATPGDLDSTMLLPVKTEPEDSGYDKYACAIPVETEVGSKSNENEEDWGFFADFLNQYGSAPSQSKTALAFGNSEARSSNLSNKFEFNI